MYVSAYAYLPAYLTYACMHACMLQAMLPLSRFCALVTTPRDGLAAAATRSCVSLKVAFFSSFFFFIPCFAALLDTDVLIGRLRLGQVGKYLGWC